MSYTEAIQLLDSLRLFGASLGLDTTLRLAALSGQPQELLRFIHVAGTNGKGSTCAMLEGIYRAAGLRTGLYTSPHLVSFRERIQVGGRLITEEELARQVEAVWPLLESFPLERRPTFFEVVTVIALRFFAEQHCDLVVWETGLGGRLDATNIVRPLASLITNVSLDHQAWLGDTLEKIAVEKAGILKPGVPALTTTGDPQSLEVIAIRARQLKCPLIIPDILSGERWTGGELPLLGEHQKVNAALALATVDILQPQIFVSAEDIRAGLAGVRWPGRLQMVSRPGGRTMVLDGAHNPAGVETLATSLAQIFPGTRPVLVLGCLGDKDWIWMCRRLAPLSGRIFPVPVCSDRRVSQRELADVCRLANPHAEVTACDRLADALARVDSEPLVVVTGSLYLVGEALELLGHVPSTERVERGLNEWGRRG